MEDYFEETICKACQIMLVNIILGLLTAPWIVVHDPFPNLRNTVVGALGTSRHWYWLEYVLADDDLNQVLADTRRINPGRDYAFPQFENSHSNEIKLTTISSARFEGSLLEISVPSRVKIGVAGTIGQKADGHILLLVIDGRQPQHSLGATQADVQNILFENGAVTAANLDGGSSTTMYYQGKIINKPCNLLSERIFPRRSWLYEEVVDEILV